MKSGALSEVVRPYVCLNLRAKKLRFRAEPWFLYITLTGDMLEVEPCTGQRGRVLSEVTETSLQPQELRRQYIENQGRYPRLGLLVNRKS